MIHAHLHAHELNHVVAAVSRIRVGLVDYERTIYPQIAAQLTEAGITFEAEVKLGPRCRIDFLAGDGIGIEVKKGKPSSREIEAQLARYAGHERIRKLVLIVERCVFSPPAEVCGKPVRYIALHALWGLAL
jgi:hypothetical protein